MPTARYRSSVRIGRYCSGIYGPTWARWVDPLTRRLKGALEDLLEAEHHHLDELILPRDHGFRIVLYS